MGNTKIIAAISIIVIIIVAIFAYSHFASSTSINPSSTPSPTPSTPSVSLPNATISIEPTTLQLQTANIGQTIEVNITVSNVQNLWGWDFADLTFNSSVLNLTQVEEGPFLQSGGQTFFLSTASVPSVRQGHLPSVADALTANTTVSGSGTLATLKFTVLSAGTSPINITKADLYTPFVKDEVHYEEGLHEAINSTIVNGNIEVVKITS